MREEKEQERLRKQMLRNAVSEDERAVLEVIMNKDRQKAAAEINKYN